ncbi:MULTISPECIES: ABC transporter substrate-binding protein [Roseobacteraceae]|uniref:Arginine-binding extracellular protein ArtP n=1 Tax=Pseudosulfitobacter pseudonitzschiae TaxID=1402135 RepID=A0A221K6A2_9RHOB|nr:MULTISPECIES: ABC transporter substrate-binding protein [Roseobacteraceae]ASM74529.1 arginine-binding extracellular protein ArtP [Pseudosulfitobacter pseudonitzschiae]
MKKTNKLIAPVAGALLALSPGSVFAADITVSPDVTESGVLAIANTLDYAPFEYLDENGEQAGIIVELANAVADVMDVELDIQRTPFPSMIPGLAAGRFSVAWETFSATPERLEQVDFVMFLKAGVAASTLAANVKAFAGDYPLCGKAVGVSAGSVADFLVEKLDTECTSNGLDTVNKSVFNTSTDIVQAVLSGRIDARLDDATASSFFEVESKGKLVVLPTLYEVSPLGMAIAKDDPDTANMMQQALAAVFENGTYKAVLDKYGMDAYAITEPYFVGSMDDLRQD